MDVPEIATIAFTSEDGVTEVTRNLTADGFDSLEPPLRRRPTVQVRPTPALEDQVHRPGAADRLRLPLSAFGSCFWASGITVHRRDRRSSREVLVKSTLFPLLKGQPKTWAMCDFPTPDRRRRRSVILHGPQADRSFESRLARWARPAVLLPDDFAIREFTLVQPDDLYELVTNRGGKSSVFTANRTGAMGVCQLRLAKTLVGGGCAGEGRVKLRIVC